MASTLDETIASAKTPSRRQRMRSLLGWLHAESIGSSTLLAFAWAFAVAMASLLLWAGVTHGVVRGILLLLAIGSAFGRRVFVRLSALAPLEGRETPVRPATKLWGELAQLAIILLGAGFCAFGSHFFVSGPVLGGFAVLLLLVGGMVARHHPAPLAAPRPDPALVLVGFLPIAIVSPLWGWRGEFVLIGLFAACGALAFWLVRLLRPPAGSL